MSHSLLLGVPQVPPLRVRPSDILDLERYYMRVVSKEQGVKLTLTQEAERALLAYSFPENITVNTAHAYEHKYRAQGESQVCCGWVCHVPSHLFFPSLCQRAGAFVCLLHRRHCDVLPAQGDDSTTC